MTSDKKSTHKLRSKMISHCSLHDLLISIAGTSRSKYLHLFLIVRADYTVVILSIA